MKHNLKVFSASPWLMGKKGSFYSLASLLSSQETAAHSGNLYQQIVPVVAEDPVRREYLAETKHCSCMRKAGWEGVRADFFFCLTWRRGGLGKRHLLKQGTFFFFLLILINVCVLSEST